MNTWFVWICQQVTANPGGMVALICVTLAVALLALIALGFGPLRSWLSRSPAPASQSPSQRSMSAPEGLWARRSCICTTPAEAQRSMGALEGLWGMWRLYREVERAESGQR